MLPRRGGGGPAVTMATGRQPTTSVNTSVGGVAPTANPASNARPRLLGGGIAGVLGPPPPRNFSRNHAPPGVPIDLSSPWKPPLRVSPSHPYALDRQPNKMAQTEGFRREIEIPTRRRPTLLGDYSSHAQALDREKLSRFRHAQEQQYLFTGYPAAPDREVVAAGSYLSRGGPVPQAAAAPQQPQPHQQVPPKRPKLAVEARPELTQPLRIDTANLDIKREPVYNPQVEAISPTGPAEDNKPELSSAQSSKEELLGSINRVDREIGKVEMQISKLQKKQSEFLAEQAKPPEAKSVTTDKISTEPKNQSIAQIIYAENRKKAESAHTILSKLGNKVDLPLYNQPSDTAVYHENKRSYMTFKKRLLLHFKKKHHSRLIRERYLTERYDQLMQAWLKRLERSENNAKRRAKDVRTREFFEKVFPELKKQREDRERIQSRAETTTPAHHSRVGANNRVGGYARSEAELEQIMDGLHEQEEEEKKMRSYAVIPPMLLDARERQIRFSNNNGRIEDPMTEYKERQVFNVWTQAEKDMFKERFLQHPKNFGYIASFLERKSVQECVQYYYLSKKNENYKQLLRKQSVKKRKFPKHPRMRPGVSEEKEDKPELVNDTEAVPIINTTPERKPQDERDRGPGPAAASVPPAAAPTAATPSTSPAPVTTSAPVTTTSEQVAASTQPATLPTPTTTTTSVGPTVPGEAAPAPCPEPTPSTTLPPTTTVTEDKVKTEVKTEVKVEPAEENSEAPKEVVPGDQGTHQCAICKSDLEHYARSRPLTKANCENYGIKEADLKHDMRVCSSCRCHSVRKRYTHCPVPMCKTPKRKVKRLRPLPSKWGELPNELKDPIIKELQLTDETKRCCSACFNRIARRLGNNPQTNEPLVPLVPENNDEVVETPRWTEEEMEVAKEGLREHGRDWAAISALVATKSEAQCKNFYFNYKRKFGLEQLVEDSKRNKGKDGGDGRTISTSESVTSTITAPSEEDLTSSDEDNGEDNDETSDTASAPSPPPVHRSDQRHDSSTVEAMEVDEKKDVDKSVVEEKPAGGLATTNPTLSASQGSLRSIPDYDSSATLSADEGPPSSSHTHDTDRERKSEPVPTAAAASTATSEQYVSSSRTYTGTPSSGPPQSKPLLQGTAPGHSNMPGPGPNMPQEGAGMTNHRRTVEIREGSKAPAGLMDRRSSPACVRDLIDCAIERNIVQDQRNIVQDLRTQKEQQAAMGDYHGHPLAQHMVPTSREGATMPGTGHLPPQAAARMPFAKEAVRKELSHRDTPELAQSSSAPTSSSRPIVVDGPGRHTDSPYPHPSYAPQPQAQPRAEDQEVQDLSRRPLTQPVRDRSPHTVYKGNPRDYDPHDPRYHELYRRHAQQPETVQSAHLRAPPPAHSHHPGMKRHGAAPSEGLHQLASAASEREPHRPHSEPREKSPSTYMPERSQMTPPALRQSVSPYPMDRQQQQHARQQAQMGRNTHGGPPPLIKQAVGGKPPMKSEKMSPIGQPPPGKTGGSITQGTPVQHPPSSQPQSARFEGSISMGTPRGYDPGMRAAPVAPGGSISMGTPRYEQGATRGTPPMHPEGGMAPRMPGMYDRATYEATIRMMQDRGEMYRRLSPTGQPGTAYYPASMAGYAVPQQAAAQQYQSELSSSRAVLMGDFLTAQQMQHAQEAQRRADKERQLSPRSRDSMGREAIPGKPYAATVMEAGMPPPFGPMYVHAGQVPGSQQERIGGGRTASPMPSPQEMAQQQQQQPREGSGHPAGWPQGHPGVSRGVAPSQASPGGQQQPDDHRHPTPPPRQNVIRSITHGTAGSMIMERMPSPRSAPQVNTHLNGSSPFATLVNVAVNAPSLAVPPKDRHQLSPSIRDHPKERAHAIAMEQERHERENERRDREAQIREGSHPRDVHHRDAALSEAQRREAQYHREAQEREALRQREAHQRGVHHREALAREQAREDHHRGIQRAREAQQAQLRDLDRRDQEIMLANRYSKEMEARQAAAVNAERERQERHEREKMERERMDMMMNDAHNREGRPSSREGYHGHPRPPGSSGTMRQLDRPPEPRAQYRNHMEGGPPGPSSYPYHMSQHSGSGPHHAQNPPPPGQRPEAVSMAQRPPSRDSKLLEAQERRTEFHSKEGSAMGPNKSGSGGGGGSSGSSAGSAGPAETFTAANLIDAIIIHTINNGSNSNEEDKMAGHGGSSGGSREPASSSSGPASSEQTTKYMHNSLAAAQSRQPHHGQPPHSSSSQPPVSQSHHHLPHPSQPSHHHLPPHHQPPHHHHHPHQQQQQQQHPGGGKIDLTKDQRSPPYKPHKHGYEPPPPPHLDVSSHHTDSLQSSHPHHPQQRHHPPQHHHQQQQPHQQQTLQRELSSSSTSSHQGVSSSADVERSQGGSPASDKSVKSNHSAQSSASSRAITLGEHIDAIIIQDYTRKGGQGSSPNNGHSSADSSIHPTTHEGTIKSEDMSSAELSAIKSFLASGNNSHQSQQHHQQQQQHHHQQQQQQQQKPPQQTEAGMSMAMAAQSPPMRPMSSPSSHGVGHSMAPDSSGSGMGSGLPPPAQSRGGDMPGRQRSMSVGNQHKQPLPYRPPPMLGTHEHLMREAARTGASAAAAAASGGGEPHSGHHHPPPPPQPLHNGPHRHPSPQPPPPQHTQPHGPPPQQSAQVHRPTPPPSQQQQQQHATAEQGAANTAAGDNRPRSFSAGAHNKMAPQWNNWKVKRALQQQEREQQQHSQQVLAASGHPQPASTQSPMVLAPDEREIVKVARLEAAADPRVSQSGQPDRRSPLVGYNMDPISPASSSTDSGGPESSMKTSPPRSPRIHQGGSGGVSLGMLGHAALTPGHQPSTQSQKGLPAGGGQHQQISTLAASHQAITSLLSRPQNKQTSSFPADSSVMGQRGEPSPTGHRQHVNPLTYVQDKIAEVMQNSEASPRPSSSTASPVDSAGGSWDKRHMLHPLDAGRYGGPRGPVESSTHRGEWAGDRYLGGRSPLRDDTVTASRQRSPRPSIHSQSSEESQGSAVSSAEDVYNATSSTGAMKPPSSTGSGGGPPPPGALAGRDYRDRLVSSPMMAADGSGYPHSPRPSYTNRMGSMAMAESSSSSRSPQFSPVGTSDMVVSGSGEDMMRPNQSGAASEPHSSDHRTHPPPAPAPPHARSSHVQSPREPVGDTRRMSVDNTANSSSMALVESPPPHRMVIDEVGGADSSAQALERISPSSDGSQTAASAISTSQHQQGSMTTPSSSSNNGSRPDYMDVDSQSAKLARGGGGSGGSEAGCRAPGVAQSPHHTAIESSSASVTSAISSSGPPHVDSSRNYSSPHYSPGELGSGRPGPGPGNQIPPQPHSVHTSSDGGGNVSTSSAAAANSYGGRYLYPGLANQHTHNGAPMVQRASPATSPAPINREADTSPLLQPQYDALSDDE